MKFRTLGKTGLRVSEIGVGAWQLGGPLLLDGQQDGHPDLGADVVTDLIRRCGEELGINFIDTAEQYGAGESERRVGAAMEGQRDRWIISTKFGAQVGDVTTVNGVPSGKRVNDLSAKRLPISLDESLKRLRTDRIDVYVYHNPPDRGEAEAIARLLDDAKRSGKVRAVGISTNNLDDVRFLHSLNCCDVVQFASNLLDPAAELRTFLAQHDIGGVVRGAFAAGKLSGKYFDRAPAFDATDIRKNWFDPKSIDREFQKFAPLRELVTSERTMPQLALRFLLDLPTTHTVILGAKSFDAYRDAARAPELAALSRDEHSRIGMFSST